MQADRERAAYPSQTLRDRIFIQARYSAINFHDTIKGVALEQEHMSNGTGAHKVAHAAALEDSP